MTSFSRPAAAALTCCRAQCGKEEAQPSMSSALHRSSAIMGARPPMELGLPLSSAMDEWERGPRHYSISAICKPELGGEGELEFFGQLLSSASFCSSLSSEKLLWSAAMHAQCIHS
ncbi:hypothetical protein Dimus_017926 [Dionaea muscipula]